MLPLDAFDLDELAAALADQENFDSHWLLNQASGELQFWNRDEDTEDELDDPDLVEIEPIPAAEWRTDLVEFAAGLSDVRLREELASVVQGAAAFRRFRDLVFGTEVEAAWDEWRVVRSRRRAVEWLASEEFVDADVAAAYVAENPDPALP